MLQRKFELASKMFDSGTKFTLREGGELIEKRLDHGRVKDNHDELEGDPV